MLTPVKQKVKDINIKNIKALLIVSALITKKTKSFVKNIYPVSQQLTQFNPWRCGYTDTGNTHEQYV